jgi:hypothetical protein
MQTIYKYPLDKMQSIQQLTLPMDAKILSVQVQNSQICLWALIGEQQRKSVKYFVNRVFRIAGTGHAITEDADKLKYLATVQLHDGALVLHVFEVER